MRLFNKLSVHELEAIDTFKILLDEVKQADAEMRVSSTREKASEIITLGNSFSDAITEYKHVITNLSVHQKKHFNEVREIGSEVRSIRDMAITYLDISDGENCVKKAERQIDWERTVIERLLSVKPIRFYNNDKGYRGNVISQIPNGEDWQYLRDELAKNGKLPIDAWKKVRNRSEEACKAQNVPWEFGDGSQSLEG